MAEALDNSLNFDLPKNRSSVIKVIGVGGGGSNAVNHMKRMGINGVDFIVCNTDAQALQHSPVENKIQLGVNLTEGLGAGANPEVGRQAGEESIEEVRQLLSNNTRMVFITAGMGGGTGTGAAPVIARCAKEMGILTVGIVTKPFSFEGKIRASQAIQGIEELRQNVDSLIVINNDKLREVYGNLSYRNSFAKADEVLATAAKGIAEVITYHFTTNIDLRDVRTVLENSGTAIMGSATAGGADRATQAVAEALDSPLLDDNHIYGAKNVLLLLVSGEGDHEITMDEMGFINEHIQNEAGGNANVIMGIGIDEKLTDEISVTIIATGFPANQREKIQGKTPEKIVHTLDDEHPVARDIFQKSFTEIKIDKSSKPVAAVQPDLFSLEVENKKAFEEPVAAPPVEPVVPAPTIEVVSEAWENIELPVVIDYLDDENEPFISPANPVLEVKEEVEAAQEDFQSESGLEPILAGAGETDLEEKDDFLLYTLDDDNSPAYELGASETPVPSMEWETGANVVALDEITFELDDIEGDGIYLTQEEETEASAEEAVAEIDPIDKKISEVLNQPVLQNVKEPTRPLVESKASEPKEEPRKIVHTLDDLIELENMLGVRKPETKPEPTAIKAEEPEDAVFDFKVHSLKEPLNPPKEDNEDLLNKPLSVASRQKMLERKNRLQAFNYQFKEHANLAMSSEPAFRRQGLELNADKYSTKYEFGRMSLNDNADGVELKTNNSFLHDNVD